ncbi:hypothetical protein M427DRAFT_53042 [Gonapodya prolifera JEL478]|uniref:Uncharacterized protein n=1 Tax=Gonapodya prolifera (strain JEL478) TaxID=1344416 RepID=A0A139ASC5_GONPJ|nr:hypothetical protein M427DRAFT_53042 [Gonapodya prolifera JEL478]|eukprot:KXS19637.1 hypothetical protein M427DRAFT_53042 [Gonapodya prolifera JEL478]
MSNDTDTTSGAASFLSKASNALLSAMPGSSDPKTTDVTASAPGVFPREPARSSEELFQASAQSADLKFSQPAKVDGKEMPADGYNDVGEPLINGGDGKMYRASDATRS